MAADTVSLTYKADIADLRAKLASIPDITAAEARKAVGELDKAMKAAAKAQQQAAQAAKDSAAKMAEMAKATKDASFGSDELGRSAVKLRGILGTIDPRLGEMAGLVDDLVDGFEGLELMSGASASALSGVGVALGAAALAAAGVGTAYLAATNHSQAMAEEAGHVAGALEAARSRTEATSKAMAALAVQMAAFSKNGATMRQALADINNGTSQLEILQRAAEQSVRDGAEEVLKAAAERATALDIERQRQEALVASMAKTDAAYGDELARLQFLNKATKDAQRDAAFLNKERDEQISMARDVAEYNYLLAESQNEVGRTTRKLTQDTKALVEVEEQWINAATYEVLNTHAPLEDLSTMRQRLHDEALAQVEEQAAAQEDAAARIRAAQQDAALAMSDSVAQGMGALSSLLETQAEKGGENASKLAAAAKGFAIAQLTLTGIQASLAAIAPPPVGYGPTPAGAIAAGVAAASTAAAIAQASAVTPSFNDTPTTMRMEKGGAVRLAPGDYFAAAQKPEDLQRQVGGGGPSTIVVQQVWRNRMVDRVVADTYQRGGKLRRTLGAGQRRKGHFNGQ